MKFYYMTESGNCLKVAWMLRLSGKEYERVPTSFVDGGTKKPEFLAKNPNGQVPLLELDDGRRVAESDAILLYLAEQAKAEGKADLIPSDPYQRALVYQWLFFEQYTHEKAIAVRRANVLFKRPCPEEQMQDLLDRGHKALGIMDAQLGLGPYLVGDKMTVADMALFAYTHVAHEGEFKMDDFPNVQKWLKRIREDSGFGDDWHMEQMFL
eukprot:Nitzschia sp. Nitz4//scaffold38_size140716//126592//127221//NITZ4_003173-RA/size140716-processed-gene-0.46-mRNA-1//1//CDS//3329550156//1288//frame0